MLINTLTRTGPTGYIRPPVAMPKHPITKRCYITPCSKPIRDGSNQKCLAERKYVFKVQKEFCLIIGWKGQVRKMGQSETERGGDGEK